MPVYPDEVDRLLVEELNQLSVNDRERVMEEVHGISTSDTGGSLLEEALSSMQTELDRHYYCGEDVPHDCAEGSMTRSRSSSMKQDANSPILNHDSSLFTSFPFSSSPVFSGAYREARSNNSELVSDLGFRYGFLVATNFNPKKAALRLMLYLERMKELYETSDVLYRVIFIDDLHKEAREELAMGSYQILPNRDSSGRRIFVYLRDICPKVSPAHRSQVFMYFAQKFVEEPKGMVCVAFLHNSTLFTGIENKASIFEQSRKIIECIPTQFRAIHFCMPNKPFYFLVKSAIMLVMGTENRLRLRIHLGSHLECRHNLSTFGIPVDRLPMTLELNTTLRKDNITNHTKWLRMQRSKEAAIKEIHFSRCRESAGSVRAEPKIRTEAWNSDMCSADFTSRMSVTLAPEVVGMTSVNIFRSQFVECPRHEDCLFGRGRNTMKHPGNVAMRSLIEGKRDRYACAAHQKKSEIAWEVVNEIKTGGGRFLREQDTGFYTMVDDETARKKISIAFRDLKNKVGKQNMRILQKQQLQEQVLGQEQTFQQPQQQHSHKGNLKFTTNRPKFF